MRPRQLATVALLLLVAGCGPSAEERYQNAVQLHETEQKELDRIYEAWDAWANTTDMSEQTKCRLMVWRAEDAGATDAEMADLKRNLDSAMAPIMAKAATYKAEVDAQAARVEKARAARDAADKARK